MAWTPEQRERYKTQPHHAAMDRMSNMVNSGMSTQDLLGMSNRPNVSHGGSGWSAKELADYGDV